MSSRDQRQDLLPHGSYTLDLQRAEPAGGTVLLTIVGDIDDHSVGLFEAGLERLADQAGTLVVDLTPCPSISSAGLQALAGRRRGLRDGASLVLVAHDPNVLRLLELVGLTRTVRVCPSVESALTTTEPGAPGPAPRRPDLGLVPPATGADAGASDPPLGPGFRIVAEQPLYSAAWL